MLSILKKIYKVLLYGFRGTSKIYISQLKKKGVKIGENVTFYEPHTNYIDDQKPWLISIGNNVEITRGVVIITHDYAWSVIKQRTGEIIGSRGKVQIGNNVFIGINTVIMPGVTIGDNVIIGANSLITKDIPSDSIVAGSPAIVIGDIESYIHKRREKYVDDAVVMFHAYYRKVGETPPVEIFDEFFWLFEKRDISKLPKKFILKMELTGNYNLSEHVFMNSEPLFDGYDKFIEYCMSKK